MKNKGYYIIPFSVDVSDSEIYERWLNERYSRCNCFTQCRYLFSYVLSQFIGEDAAVQCYELFPTPSQDLFSVYAYDTDGRRRRVDTSTVSLAETKLYMFSRYLGFLSFAVDYGELTEEEIEWFAHSFKRMYWKRKQDGVNLPTELNKTVSQLLGPKARPFFYERDEIGRTSHILQLVNIDEQDETTVQDILCAMGRGHTRQFSADLNTFAESPFDIRYAPTQYIEWVGSPNVLSCVVKNSIVSQSAESFVNNVLPNHFSSEYLCIYLVLLNQRYTVMYLLQTLMEHRSGQHKDEVLDFIGDALDSFRNEASFMVVSKEMNYQNIYAKMLEVMEIDKLLKQTESINQRILLRAQQEEEERDNKTNRFLMVLSFLAIGSALIDLAGFLDRLGIKSTVATIISVVITLIVAVSGFVIMFSGGKHHRKKR